MKNVRFVLTIFCLMIFTSLISAQEEGNKKIGERVAAQFDKMATDLGLTAEQKAMAVKLSTERMQSVAEKMKAATTATDEEKKEIRKAGAMEYNKKLDDAFGKELADKMRAWQKENGHQRPPRPQ